MAEPTYKNGLRPQKIDDHDLAIIMAVLRLLDHEHGPGDIERAYSQCFAKVEEYRSHPRG